MAKDRPDLVALRLLSDVFGLSEPPLFRERLAVYRDLVSTWNVLVPLLSATDLRNAFYAHVADSLALVPLVRQYVCSGYRYLDVGTGNGLPAVPILLYLDSYCGVLVERNARKAAFLRVSISKLQLVSTELVEGSFPEVIEPTGECVLTARAMEKPERFLENLALGALGNGVFLRQSGSRAATLPPGLVESPVHDAFDEAGLRRGHLGEVRALDK